MEDQGKRLLLAVLIAFGLLWAWNMIFPSKPPKKGPDKEPAHQVEKQNKAPVAETQPDKAPTPVERGTEKVVKLDLGHVSVELSSYGAALKSWKLLDPRLEDRRVSPPVPLELVPTAKDGADFYSFQTWLGDGPLAAMRSANWELVEKSDRGATFRWQGNGVELIKKYRIDPDLFLLDMTLDVIKKEAGPSKHELTIGLYGFQNLKEDTGGGYSRMPREWKTACLVGGDVKTRSAKQLLENPSKQTGDIKWGGLAHSYFVAIAAPEHKKSDRLDCDSYAIDDIPGAMRVELGYPEVRLDEAGSRYQRHVVAYFGPKYMNVLQAASAKAGFNPDFQEVVDLGWLSIISGPLLWLLTLFQRAVVNWGLAIICLTLVIKLLLLPWTHKSIKSMKAMSKLRPQMEKIKEKYEDDKQQQQVEMMNLFKSHGVNPLAGCLPMLLQMPIWFALYRMLRYAGELYQAPFIPGWINDLTAPDPFHVLPILVTGMMFVQTRLTPTTATGTQQKLLMYGMPAMFGFFSIFFPAGLTLYIFTNTCLTLVHHFFVHREDRIKARVLKSKGKSDEADEGGAADEGKAETEAKKSQPKSGSSAKGKGKGSAPKAAATEASKKRKSGTGKAGAKGRGKKGKKKKTGRK